MPLESFLLPCFSLFVSPVSPFLSVVQCPHSLREKLLQSVGVFNTHAPCHSPTLESDEQQALNSLSKTHTYRTNILPHCIVCISAPFSNKAKQKHLKNTDCSFYQLINQLVNH